MGKIVHRLFLSHRLDALADQLAEEVSADRSHPLKKKTVLVPNHTVKQWLFLHIAKKKGIAMGWKAVTPDEMFQKVSRVDLFCAIYEALSQSGDAALLSFLEGKKNRLLHLASELSTLFLSYGRYGKTLFDLNRIRSDWQERLLQQLFVEGPLRMPLQQLAEQEASPLYCFGIDELPPLYWEFLFRSPFLSLYLFSPCREFWEDLATDRERRRLNRFWKKKGAAEASRRQLDAYLRDAPPLLANWGKLGRETLKKLDAYDLEIEEIFPSLDSTSLLKQVQSDLLYFRQAEKEKRDSSIQIFQTGSSRLHEVECVREEILRLEIPFHEIVVLAPDIKPYVPLIEFVFGDVPYRISGFDGSMQSSFRLGLSRLLGLGRWEAEALLSLLETPSFYRKQGWGEEKIELVRTWIRASHIKWGQSEAHQKEVLASTFRDYPQTLSSPSSEFFSASPPMAPSASVNSSPNEISSKSPAESDGLMVRGQPLRSAPPPRGCWEEGLDRLLDSLVYLRPLQVEADLFEEFLGWIFELKKISLSGKKTLPEWANYLESLASQFLFIDSEDEADMAAQNCFQQTLQDFRTTQLQETLVPFEVAQQLLFRPCPGQIHASSLHAVRFAPLKEAALLPAKALFLMGMDEEGFPHLRSPSSLDLLRKEKISIPEEADRDRYLFLQALFSAQEYLCITYGHLSADEGKPVNPSLLVQELVSFAGGIEAQAYQPRPYAPAKENTFWPDLRKCPELQLPQGEMTLSLFDLRQLARNPWKFFLQKTQGMYLDDSLEDSFSLQKAKLVREALERPLSEVLSDESIPAGPLGEALRREIQEKASEWQVQRSAWDLHPFTLLLQENCEQLVAEENRCLAPAIELNWEGLKVRLVGEIHQATLKGLLCMQDDSVAGVLKVWPEALALALSLNAPQIWMVKSGKVKQLQEAERHLKAFVEYYFRSLLAPSPLLPDWADALLRKGKEEFEKKMKKRARFENPILDWVLARSVLPEPQEIIDGWGPYLKKTFSGLIDLYSK